MIAADKTSPEKGGKVYDVLVVGGGVTGLAAAMRAGRLGLQALLLEKTVFGGSVAVLENVDNVCGIESTGGWEFTQAMVKEAEAAGCRLRDSTEVTGVSGRKNGPFAVSCSEGMVFRARSIIVCSGGSPRALGLQNETHFTRRGIHTCAQCAGGRYKGLDVVVAGNGSFAALAARHLLELGCRLFFVSGDAEISTDAPLVKELERHKEFHFLSGSHVTGLLGDDFLEAVEVTDLVHGERQALAAASLFVYPTIVPESGFVYAVKDSKGFLAVDGAGMTSLAGIFAAGRVVSPDLSIAAMAEKGSRTALAAESWLRANG